MMRKNFYIFLDKLIFELQQYFLANDYNSLFDDLSKIKNKIRIYENDDHESNFLENVTNILKVLISKLYNNTSLESLCLIIFNFSHIIPKQINEFYYSIQCCELKKTIQYYSNKSNQSEDIAKVNKVFSFDFNNSFFNYYYKFKKNIKLHQILSGKKSNKLYFKEILKDKEFRSKILNFYSSKKMIQFIHDCCGSEEKKIISKLPYLCELLKKDDFWDRILLFPLSKNKMATVENYLRIVINTHYIKYKRIDEFNKKSILKLVLFELLAHELFHLLRRLNYPDIEAKKALTPPSAKYKDSFNAEHGEIGKRLIYYFFNVEKIVMITSEAAKMFESLTFEKDEDIEKLKIILLEMNAKGLSETAYARFTYTELDGIILEIQDCRDFLA